MEKFWEAPPWIAPPPMTATLLHLGWGCQEAILHFLTKFFFPSQASLTSKPISHWFQKCKKTKDAYFFCFPPITLLPPPRLVMATDFAICRILLFFLCPPGYKKLSAFDKQQELFILKMQQTKLWSCFFFWMHSCTEFYLATSYYLPPTPMEGLLSSHKDNIPCLHLEKTFAT